MLTVIQAKMTKRFKMASMMKIGFVHAVVTRDLEAYRHLFSFF